MPISASTLRLSGTRSKAEPLRAGIYFHRTVQHKYVQYSQSAGHTPAVRLTLETHLHVITHTHNHHISIRSFVLVRLLGFNQSVSSILHEVLSGYKPARFTLQKQNCKFSPSVLKPVCLSKYGSNCSAKRYLLATHSRKKYF